MIELDGIEYQVKSAQENCDDMVGYINDYCASHDIKNSLGELIQIDKNRASPFYLLLLGLGYLVSGIQNLVFSAGCSLNIARSSERQLLDLCDIAGVRRNNATKTTIKCQIFVKAVDDYIGSTSGADTQLHITKDMSVTLASGSDNIIFHPAYEMWLDAGTNQMLVLVAESEGPYSFAANAFSNFDQQPKQVLKIIADAAVSGHAQETIPELRQRLLDRKTNYPITQQVSEAISELEGVTFCNVIFNYDSTTPMSIGSVLVAPRKALVLVQGYNDRIAEVYYQYMLAESQEAPNRSLKQDWISRQGQKFPVYITPPKQHVVFVQVVVNAVINSNDIENLQECVCTIANQLEISESLDAARVVTLLRNEHGEIPVINVQLKLDGAAEWAYIVKPEQDELIALYKENVVIQEY